MPLDEKSNADKTSNILVVENESTDFELLKRHYLHQRPEARLTRAATLAEGLATLKSDDFDGVICDLNLGDGSGIDLVRRIREEDENLPILILTGAGSEKAAVEAIKEGANDYLSKDNDFLRVPYVTQSLINAVKAEKSRQQTAAELQNLEERFKDFAEAASDWFWEIGSDLTFTFVDASAREILGVEPSHFLGRTLWDVVKDNPPEGLEEHEKDVREHLQFRDFAYEIEGGDGSIRIVRVSGKPIFGENEEFLGYRGSGADVTEQVRAERMANQFKSTLDRTLDCIFMFDPQTLKFFYINQGAIDQVGYTEQEMMDMTPLDIKPEFTPEQFRAMIDQLIAGPQHSTTFETVHEHKNGNLVPVEIFLQFIQSPGDNARFVAVVRDITERRHLEDRLRQSQKLEAIGQLTGGIAHDFNNLMMVINGNADIIEENEAASEEIKTRAASIKKSIARGAALTDHLLSFARQKHLETKATDVAKSLDEFTQVLTRTLGETISLDLQMADDLWPALVDSHQLENAVLNLTLNARDAMADEGHLIIEASNVALAAGELKSSDEVVPGDYVRLCVHDNGAGIAPENMSKVFDPFFTTKDFASNSGLGLSMVYGFARQSNGYLTIDSAVGEGTKVYIYLPRAEAAAEETKETNTRLEASGNGRVLVVEDDDDVRDVTTTILSGHGYEVTSVSDGPQALAKLENGEKYDLLFTDIVMPGGLDGISLAEKALNLQPGIKLLGATGYADKAPSNSSERPEGMEILGKPYSRLDLLARVADLVAPQ